MIGNFQSSKLATISVQDLINLSLYPKWRDIIPVIQMEV